MWISKLRLATKSYDLITYICYIYWLKACGLWLSVTVFLCYLLMFLYLFIPALLFRFLRVSKWYGTSFDHHLYMSFFVCLSVRPFACLSILHVFWHSAHYEVNICHKDQDPRPWRPDHQWVTSIGPYLPLASADTQPLQSWQKAKTPL